MLAPSSSGDLVRAAADALLRADAPRDAFDLAVDLRGRGWTVESDHLDAVLTRTSEVFLRVGDTYRLLPEGSPAAARHEVTWEQVREELLRMLVAPWWSVLLLHAAHAPPAEEPTSDLARRMADERRSRVYRVAKVHDTHCWLLAWVDHVTLTRRDALPGWSCWAVADLPGWAPGRDPLQLRYTAVDPAAAALVRAEATHAAMADLLVAELSRGDAAAGDVWIEPVPVDGPEVEARERTLTLARRPQQSTGRHAAQPACRWCAGVLTDVEDRGRGAHAGCWAAEEPAESAVVCHTRRDWVGAVDRDSFAALVATPPRGGARGLSRGRVGGGAR